MEGAVLLGSFAAIAVFGYYLISRLDRFLEEFAAEKQGEAARLNVAVSSLNALPSVSNALKDITARHPDARCSLSLGREQDVIASFDAGEADVAIVSAEAESGIPARWKCVALPPQAALVGRGAVEIRTMEKAPGPQKVLWKSGDPHSLALEFICQLCGQRP